MDLDEVQIVGWNDSTFDGRIRRNRFVLGLGEVLIHGQMVVRSPEAHRALEHVAVVCWLLNEPLHALLLCLARGRVSELWSFPGPARSFGPARQFLLSLS